MRERLLFYLTMEVVNYATMIYEIQLIGFSLEQSLICRLFASLTDLVVVIFFFNTKKIWDPDKRNKTIKDHLLAGVKLLIQFPVIYMAKIIFVNSVAIPKLRSAGFGIEIISWPDIVTTVIVTIVFCLTLGTVYSLLREKIFFSFIFCRYGILKFKKARF